MPGLFRLNTLRWLLVPVAALGAWGASILIGATLLDLVTRLCPAEQMVSGLCTAPWWPYAERTVFCVSAAIAAALVVAATTLTAPSHRRIIAIVVFLAGLAFAVFFAVAAGAYLELVAAAASGGLTTNRMRRRG